MATSTAADWSNNDHALQRARERNREAKRRWREAHRKLRARRAADDIGLPIWEGDWATDDFERCEA